MLFNSAAFLFLFLPVTLAGYFALGAYRPTLAALWLILASAFFYANWNPPFIILLTISVFTNYAFSLLIWRYTERPLLQSATLALAIIANLLALFYFKYLFPLLGWLASFGFDNSLSTDNIILPLGISFFTFTQLGYLIDVRAGGIKERGLLNYLLFVIFFPHLIAGPILHHREVMPQFANPKTYRLNPDDVSAGFILFAIGLAKKRFIADNFSPLVDVLYNNPNGASLQLAWLGTLAYSIQLYFDFSGYSDMANGLARIFGVRFPLNFNSPYKAKSIIDFWQRWHMTLTRYLTAYLYNPAVLWITRKRLAQGRPISRKAVATPDGFAMMIALPMFYTMVLAGIWHGAGLQFLIFGLLHGLYLTINHAWRVFSSPSKAIWPLRSAWLIASLQVLLVYFCVIVAQVFFRANSVSDALQILCGMSGLNGMQFDPLAIQALQWKSAAAWAGLVALALAVVWLLPNSNEILAIFEKRQLPPMLQSAVYAILVFVIVVGASGPPVQFLYFQF